MSEELREIAHQIQYWLDYQEREYQGKVTDDTHLMSPPVWPTRGMLKNWIAAISQQTEPVAWMRHRVMSGHGFGGGVVCEFSEQKFSDINDPEAEIEPLYTAPQSGVREVNTDTVSVPSEPTKQMLDAGGNAHWGADLNGNMLRTEAAHRIYNAMLRASQEGKK